jgi:hypothetical protein
VLIAGYALKGSADGSFPTSASDRKIKYSIFQITLELQEENYLFNIGFTNISKALLRKVNMEHA